MSRELFGTDGIRGLANRHPITSEVALNIGRALTHLFQNGQKPKILIGKDTRLSGYMIENALSSGICSMGGDVILIGPMPTPGIAFLTQAMRADAGIVISASHNLFADNGIKIFDRNGFKLADEQEEKIEAVIQSGVLENRPTGDKLGRARRVEDAPGRYIEFTKSTFPKGMTLEGLGVVIDCANGATYHMAPTILHELGASVSVIGASPNGLNINDNCGAVSPKKMAEEVKRTGANIGIALDGDGDRVVLSDEQGRIIDGDALLAVLGEFLLKKGKLPSNKMVATIMSNQGLDRYFEARGGSVVRSAVGDRYVMEKMREDGLNFGGESSGHIIFPEYSTTGDGLVAALQFLSLMKESGKKISELVKDYHPLPQVLTNVRVRERKDLKNFPDVQKLMDRIEGQLGHEGRILVRYSGTEPLVRIMIEGEKEAEIRQLAGELSSCIEKALA
jgi:phosphoglucosamine mutase